MSARWVPLSVRRGLKDSASFEVLYEGVPQWIRHQLREWVEGWLSHDPDSLALAQTMLQLDDLGWGSGGFTKAWGNLQANMLNNDELFLDVLDFILAMLVRDDRDVHNLKMWLELGGSAWTVNYRNDAYGLERRVDETVGAAVDGVIAESGRAGSHLAKAWKEVYGRHPDPSTSYRESVRAVEVASIAVVSPNDRKATLGRVAGEMGANPQLWNVTINAASSVEALVGMMNLLWRGQGDRHGTPDETVPLDVSQQEAEAAVHLAVTLVHWFDKGFVSRA